MRSRGDSEVTWFEGNYQAFHEHQKKLKGDDWQPHRVRYRPFRR